MRHDVSKWSHACVRKGVMLDALSIPAGASKWATGRQLIMQTWDNRSHVPLPFGG